MTSVISVLPICCLFLMRTVTWTGVPYVSSFKVPVKTNGFAGGPMGSWTDNHGKAIDESAMPMLKKPNESVSFEVPKEGEFEQTASTSLVTKKETVTQEPGSGPADDSTRPMSLPTTTERHSDESTSSGLRVLLVENTKIYVCDRSKTTCKNQCDNEYVPYGEIFMCSCKPTCKLTGKCCHDFETYCGKEPGNKLVDAVEPFIACKHLSIGKYIMTDEISYGNFAVVAKCPAATTKEIAAKCDGRRSPEKIEEIFQYVPVVYGDVVFANSHCLLCHTSLFFTSDVTFIRPTFDCNFVVRPTTLLYLVFKHCYKSFKGFTLTKSMKCADNSTCVDLPMSRNHRRLCNKYQIPVKDGKKFRKVLPFCDSCNMRNVSCTKDENDGHGSDIAALYKLFSLKDERLCAKNEYVDIKVGGCRLCPTEDIIENDLCARDYKLFFKLNFTTILKRNINDTDIEDLFHNIIKPLVMKLGDISDVTLGDRNIVCLRTGIKTSKCSLTIAGFLSVYRNGQAKRILSFASENLTVQGIQKSGSWIFKDGYDAKIHSAYVTNQNKTDCLALREYTDSQFSFDEGIVVINSTKERYHLSNQEVLYRFKLLSDGKEVKSQISICEEVKNEMDYLSDVLLSLSIFGLAAVFLAHCFYKDLRNQPGLNLMSLCPNLLFADLFFLLGPVVGKQQGVVCTLSAIAQHFFWMSSFAWMSVIAIDTWWTFRPDSIRTSQVASKKSFAKSCLYAYGSAMLVVATSVIVTYSFPELHFKYGDKKSCWLGNFYQKIATFLVPVGIFCAIKLLLFVWTVVNIVKVRKVTAKAVKANSSAMTPTNFLPYVKLSVILGISWTLGFLADYDDSQVLRYVFVIINGSQGILLAIIFFSNARMRNLLRAHIHKSRDSSTISTTSGKSGME